MKRLMMITLAAVMMLTSGIYTDAVAGARSGQSNGGGAAVGACQGTPDGAALQQQMNAGARVRHFIRWHHRRVLHQLFHCMQDLDLSDETRDAIETLLADYREGALERLEMFREARLTYWEVLTAPTLDEEALAAAEAAIIEIRNENMTAKFDLAYAIRALLTDDQIAALSTCFDAAADQNDDTGETPDDTDMTDDGDVDMELL